MTAQEFINKFIDLKYEFTNYLNKVGNADLTSQEKFYIDNVLEDTKQALEFYTKD